MVLLVPSLPRFLQSLSMDALLWLSLLNRMFFPKLYTWLALCIDALSWGVLSAHTGISSFCPTWLFIIVLITTQQVKSYMLVYDVRQIL